LKAGYEATSTIGPRYALTAPIGRCSSITASMQNSSRILVSMGYLGPHATTEERVSKQSKLGSFYQSVTNCLLRRATFSTQPANSNSCSWRRLKQLKSKLPDLILGGACAHGIPWSKLNGMPYRSTAPTTLVNYYRGFETICRKTKMLDTLRSCFEPKELALFLPQSFLFFPANPELSEQTEFLAAFRNEKESAGRSLWICKPSDGSKGRAIFITEDEQDIVSTFAASESRTEENTEKTPKHVALITGGSATGSTTTAPTTATTTTATATTTKETPIEPPIETPLLPAQQRRLPTSTGNIAWVVQQYIKQPMLLEGQRKFDIRCWVLLDANFQVYVHREGVLRTTSVPFNTDPESFHNDFVHLSNHCIQTHSKDYGKYEATNEMFFNEFHDFLAANYRVSSRRREDETSSVGVVPAIVQRNKADEITTSLLPASLERDILPQIHRIIALTMHAARGRMESAEGSGWGSFQLFGYDFMVDEQMVVHLLEINSSPAVADMLLKEITEDVVNVAIRSFYTEGNVEHGEKKEQCFGGFQPVECSNWVSGMKQPRTWKPHSTTRNF